MRADRLLSILLLLQTHGRMTAAELSNRLEVSERTIHRNMEALSIAGVPVVAERGTGGGWSLLGDYQTKLTGLKEEEIQTLFLPQSSRFLADLGLEDVSKSLFLKLLAAMPPVYRQNAEYVKQRIYVDAAGWHGSKEKIDFLPTLQEAVWREVKLELAYQRSDGTRVERLVDPLGLVIKGNIWYLVAAVDDQFRPYRVSRIVNAIVTNVPFVRPQAFNLSEFWGENTSSFVANLPRYPAVVRVDSSLFHSMRSWRFARVEQISESPDSEGWVEVTVQFETEEDACQCVLSLGGKIEVIEPSPLRERVLEEAKKIMSLYSE
jgi:predicted DNA-binding transcriptional regulator YafY